MKNFISKYNECRKLFDLKSANYRNHKDFKKINFNKYIFLRLKYGLSISDYFEFSIFSDDSNSRIYLETLHKYVHTWKYAVTHFKPDVNIIIKLGFFFDYALSKIIYPGLDAMDYFKYEFYNIRYSKRKTFITEGQLKKMVKKLNGDRLDKEKKEARLLLDNKCEFNKKFSDFIEREWIDLNNTSFEEFKSFCKKFDKVIVKPSDANGGHGIFSLKYDEKFIQDYYDRLKGNNYIVEEFLCQNTQIAKFNPSSVNTIRIYSVFYENTTYVTGAVFRMGKGNAIVDNYSSGGLAAEIDINNGIVISRAVSQKNETFYIHPYSHETIIGFKIPYWNNIIELIKKSHFKIKELGYVGWDIVVLNNGRIAILEANTSGGVNLQQQPSLIGKKYIYQPFM